MGGCGEPPPTNTPPLPPGCAFSYAAYSVPASWLHSHLCQLFVPIATLNSFLCTGLSCYSRWVKGRWRVGGGAPPNIAKAPQHSRAQEHLLNTYLVPGLYPICQQRPPSSALQPVLAPGSLTTVTLPNNVGTCLPSLCPQVP